MWDLLGFALDALLSRRRPFAIAVAAFILLLVAFVVLAVITT